MSEIYCFVVEHSKFYKPNLGGFWVVNFLIIVESFIMINHFSGERPGRLVSSQSALEWPPRSSHLAI